VIVAHPIVKVVNPKIKKGKKMQNRRIQKLKMAIRESLRIIIKANQKKQKKRKNQELKLIKAKEEKKMKKARVVVIVKKPKEKDTEKKKEEKEKEDLKLSRMNDLLN